ncbi:MAG: S41 family peptidase [Steroidobacteraceae bacterium]
MRRWALLLAAAAATLGLLSACGGKGIDTAAAGTGSSNPACTPAALKDAVLQTTRDWYLFPETLPASIDPAAYPTVAAFLDALTAQARSQGKDRFFSATTGIAAENALLQGQTAGFGFTLLEHASPAGVSVAQVFAGSAAADAGFARGDELLAIGTSAADLQPIEQVLASAAGLNGAIGASTAGIVRVIRWRNLAGASFEKTLTKREFNLDAVPASSVRIVTLAGGTRVGHLSFRSFVADPAASGQPADLAALRAAFAQFSAQGVRHLVIDLRYNGGGLVSIAELLLNLMAGDQSGQVAYATRFNARQVAQQETRRFTRQAQTVPALRVAFVVTDRTASASELVINALAPYAQVAIVGTRTYGKPVGQSAFDVAACDFRLRLVTFRTVNRNEDGDYYQGLPYAGFTRSGGVACAASDDLAHDPGDPQERMTAEALAWIGSPTASCSGPVIADGLATAQVTLAPSTAGPPASPLQYYLPGTW